MLLQKIQVFHFHNGLPGGVQTVISNLFKYSCNPVIENHLIYVINKDNNTNNSFPVMEGAVSQQVFLYSPNWNFYYTARQLAKLLPGKEAIIVAHDWLELGMVSALGLQHRVVQFLHGHYDYYYQLAIRHQQQTDLFIAVAANIEQKLKMLIPGRSEDILYLRFPVGTIAATLQPREDNIIFIGRLEAAKGADLLGLVAKELKERGLVLHWHIIGSEGENCTLQKDWDNTIPLTLYGSLHNDAVLQILPQMKFMVLPSLAEGMPVALIESMKAGVIPVVNDLEGGMQELVINGETGYTIKNNDPAGYAEKIMELITNKELSALLQKQCMQRANSLFDPVANTKKIEEQLENIYNQGRRKKQATKIYGSRLDKSWMPNWIVHTLRK